MTPDFATINVEERAEQAVTYFKSGLLQKTSLREPCEDVGYLHWRSA